MDFLKTNTLKRYLNHMNVFFTHNFFLDIAGSGIYLFIGGTGEKDLSMPCVNGGGVKYLKLILTF